MHERLVSLLRCPVSGSPLQLQTITTCIRTFNDGEEKIIREGILYAAAEWFYPIVDGIPRLAVESFLDHADFLTRHLPDYRQRREHLEKKYPGLIRHILKKNKRTKQSFSLEWSLFDYQEDKTWEADKEGLLQRFLEETAENAETLKGKLIFDAGCGNGQLDHYIAGAGATVVAMDFSDSIGQAYRENRNSNAHFIQGDIQFPPLVDSRFDIVHSSGVLICTDNTELSFCCIEPLVKQGGTLSVWLYHSRKDLIHRTFNRLRSIISKLPLRMQYYLLLIVFFPPGWIIKRIKGNRQNRREMMIALMDWFTPQFRWEHEEDEAASWFTRRGYHSVRATVTGLFGFNIIGVKRSSAP
jgi:SAM-dependent methyltransferase